MASCQVELPHNLDSILSDADDNNLKTIPRDEMITQLQDGVFLKQKKVKFWVNRITSANAFELYARGLSIVWDDGSRWKWISMEDNNSCVNVEVAELVSVWWLDVKKTDFDTAMLTPGTSYEVTFVIMMKETSHGFTNVPVKLKFVLPNQEPVERTEDLSILPRNEWKEIKIGHFFTNCNMSGNINISMYNHENTQHELSGLVVNKIIIRPNMNWKALSGENNWDGLLNPLNGHLNKCITLYGDRVQAIYDSINSEKSSPMYGRHTYEKEGLFYKLGLEKNESVKCQLYEVKKYIYANVDVPFPLDLIAQDNQTWIAYVAVATDKGKDVVGRRDILVCWRGTSTVADWLKNAEVIRLIRAEVIFPNVLHPKVHKGFYSIYTQPTSPNVKDGARDQILDEVRRWVTAYQDEEVSITVTGHSLGAALATMNAADIVSNGFNMPSTGQINKEFLVTAIVFASPRVGNVEFKKEFDQLTKVNGKPRLLRITNSSDIITGVPPSPFVEVGANNITIGTTTASADEGTYKAHNLKNYIRELRALLPSSNA
ncbi:phospholipase A1-II 6-like [Mangifera indica]|uniref:phospholipase A1-II 6-like n=1 Tax=Mangifera indica TaxID=29780 RepID=UPI001CFA2C8C|nr:phospholipase A1-II 6-like [Mangifera indica]